jgi:arylsulfatase A-like enzyme
MVWEHYHDDTYRVALPEVMTDYAIDVGRKRNPDQLVVHYMQPHLPYIGKAYTEDRSPTELEMEGYKKLEAGEADKEEVYELYTDTLRLVLDEIAGLLENMDADRVAITADHGEAFGEMGAYGHPEGFPHPTVKKVPWIEVSAEDSGSREPDLDIDTGVSVDIEEHLHDLGYR